MLFGFELEIRVVEELPFDFSFGNYGKHKNVRV